MREPGGRRDLAGRRCGKAGVEGGYFVAPAPAWRHSCWEVVVIRVVAVITAKPGCREALVEAFRANAPTVRAEVGCLEYMGVVDAEGLGSFPTKYGPDVFVVIETWDSLDALKAHGAAPHMIAFGERTKALVAGRAIHVLSPV